MAGAGSPADQSTGLPDEVVREWLTAEVNRRQSHQSTCKDVSRQVAAILSESCLKSPNQANLPESVKHNESDVGGHFEACASGGTLRQF